MLSDDDKKWIRCQLTTILIVQTIYFICTMIKIGLIK